ncbi:hypothetical protein WJX79_005041 [Trebouxia sp. C0005]|nr:MAG: RNA recognition motif-containing [Trebouxia sp. A1-2]
MADLESELARFEAEIKASSQTIAGAPAIPPPPQTFLPATSSGQSQAASLPGPPPRPASNGPQYASAASSSHAMSLPPPPIPQAAPMAQAYGAQQPGYPPQRPAPPQMPQHQVPYASQPMYPQQAAVYPTYPPAAAAAPYYAAPAYQPQMHVNPMPPVQQPNQSAAQAAMMASIKADVENQGKVGKPKIDKSKAVPRAAAGQKWYDATLSEWAENDFRIFVGDMGNEVNDDILTKAFTKYATFQRAKIVRDKHSNKSKGYGFVSFSDAVEGAKALREMNGKYIGNRPCKLRKSSWEERTPQNSYKGKRKAGGSQGNQTKKPGIFHK